MIFDIVFRILILIDVGTNEKKRKLLLSFILGFLKVIGSLSFSLSLLEECVNVCI